MVQVLIILIVTAGLLVWGRIRSDVVALCSMVALVLTGVITPEEGLAGFSNSVVIMIAGLFIVGGAITQTGLARLISNKVLSLAGESELRLFYLVILVTIIVGLFVSNTGTVAILMPIVVTIAAQSGVDARRLLMPMAFACSISGMMTLIGTAYAYRTQLTHRVGSRGAAILYHPSGRSGDPPDLRGTALAALQTAR